MLYPPGENIHQARFYYPSRIADIPFIIAHFRDIPKVLYEWAVHLRLIDRTNARRRASSRVRTITPRCLTAFGDIGFIPSYPSRPQLCRYAATAIMEIRWRRSFASPRYFHAGQHSTEGPGPTPQGPRVWPDRPAPLPRGPGPSPGCLYGLTS